MENNNKQELVPFVVLARYYNTTLTTKYKNRKVWVNPIPGEIRAMLPGTILSVSVQAGETVKKGQLLVIHEAMKMQNRIVAPFDGIVQTLDVSEGEKIKKDQVIALVVEA